jgi:signal transduction histidine kinase
MARDTSSSPRKDEAVANGKNGPGVRTRVLLLTSLVLIIAGTTASSLLIVRSRLRQHVQEGLAADLRHSVETFQDLAGLRLAALEQESALLASLPSLKALMTSNDPRTIADDSVEFWHTSGNDLFGLADADGHVLAAESRDTRDTDPLKRDLQAAISDPAKHYLFSGNHLYGYSVRPLFFGTQASGTLLGYVISGYAVDHDFLVEVGRGAGVEAAFIAGKDIVVSTLPAERQEALKEKTARPAEGGEMIIREGRERFLATSKDLTGEASAPLRLVVMKSFDEADRAEREINRLMLLASLLAMAAGSLLMLLLARMVTRPLEKLAAGVRAFGEGNPRYSLPAGGTQEVRYLSLIFGEMRDEIQKKNRALLESERLATIGRMASSVSHDLRHYLAAVYANAEFLASPALPAEERQELFDEIRMAVNGTTDMLDSLLIFGRTGAALQRVPASMTSLVERAVALVRNHPDAEQVKVTFERGTDETTAALDTKQIERAVYNLLLNACQSARQSPSWREVSVSVSAEETTVSVSIRDSGLGVAEGIRESLFDPFVSQGKQKGTGLGLTLAWCVAREHDGEVKLVSSRPGDTIFRLTVSRQMIVSTADTKKDLRSTLLA